MEIAAHDQEPGARIVVDLLSATRFSAATADSSLLRPVDQVVSHRHVETVVSLPLLASMELPIRPRSVAIGAPYNEWRRVTGTMRRIAFLSDPHGDLVALHRVISDLEQAGPVDEVLMGGDLAQGGAQPGEVVDEIRERGWPSVRGNGDDLLVRIADGTSADQVVRDAEATQGPLPESVASHAEWSVSQMGAERIEYLRSLPRSLVRGPFPWGTVVLVHATPWSTEEVVLPDADGDVAERMIREARARLVVYGHIHTPYQRRVGDAALISVGAVSGSNDADPRPAYTIVNLGETITAEVRRVDWRAPERLAATRRLASRGDSRATGPVPFRCEANPLSR